MTQNTNTTNKTETSETEVAVMRIPNTAQDFRNAALIVSVVVNLFIFTAWLALQVTTQYDTQIASFLFNR